MLAAIPLMAAGPRKAEDRLFFCRAVSSLQHGSKSFVEVKEVGLQVVVCHMVCSKEMGSMYLQILQEMSWREQTVLEFD